jgi:hypothetical protein
VPASVDTSLVATSLDIVDDTLDIFCEEDTGEYCPSLGADEIELEVVGNIYKNPELLT